MPYVISLKVLFPAHMEFILQKHTDGGGNLKHWRCEGSSERLF